MSNEPAAKSSETQRRKIALIPGGVRGIGRALALRLGREGWAVAACYRQSEDAAATLREELGKIGAPAWIARADVSDASAAATLVLETERRFGGIDALVNCVGAYRRISLLDESVEGWNAMFDDNLHPVFYLCRAAAPGFIRRGRGRIVNFGMVNAEQLTAQAYVTAHYIAKAGVLVLTRSFAKLLAPHGVTANAVSPGFIDSGGVSREELAQSFTSIPAGYMGSPQDAIAVVCWLLSDEARYVNGANIQVSGAWGV
ncbi:MAG: SDR family oxidoreductase [Acidobacteriota bacterium]|jgi:3-oxoacyl-[acyl-carrier protein] reductase|nr:SDR family oxidoreductase [Acidobacteriota bacterium]